MIKTMAKLHASTWGKEWSPEMGFKPKEFQLNQSFIFLNSYLGFGQGFFPYFFWKYLLFDSVERLMEFQGHCPSIAKPEVQKAVMGLRAGCRNPKWVAEYLNKDTNCVWWVPGCQICTHTGAGRLR